jgi:cytoskeletal protein RodZ
MTKLSVFLFGVFFLSSFILGLNDKKIRQSFSGFKPPEDSPTNTPSTNAGYVQPKEEKPTTTSATTTATTNTVKTEETKPIAQETTSAESSEQTDKTKPAETVKEETKQEESSKPQSPDGRPFIPQPEQRVSASVTVSRTNNSSSYLQLSLCALSVITFLI